MTWGGLLFLQVCISHTEKEERSRKIQQCKKWGGSCHKTSQQLHYRGIWVYTKEGGLTPICSILSEHVGTAGGQLEFCGSRELVTPRKSPQEAGRGCCKTHVTESTGLTVDTRKNEGQAGWCWERLSWRPCKRCPGIMSRESDNAPRKTDGLNGGPRRAECGLCQNDIGSTLGSSPGFSNAYLCSNRARSGKILGHLTGSWESWLDC